MKAIVDVTVCYRDDSGKGFVAAFLSRECDLPFAPRLGMKVLDTATTVKTVELTLDPPVLSISLDRVEARCKLEAKASIVGLESAGWVRAGAEFGPWDPDEWPPAEEEPAAPGE